VNAVTNSPEDPRFVALVDVIRRSGAAEFQIRYDDEQDPIVWVAVVGHKMHNGRPRTGECAHCHRPTGISDDWTAEMPHAAHICWYIYDPENETFRRSCEGET
jgi:hypothetical protein